MLELIVGIGALSLIVWIYGFITGYLAGPDTTSEQRAENILEKGFEKRRDSVREQLIPIVQRGVCILDTETTGLEKSDEIVEITVLDFEGNVLLDTLVKPTCKISKQAAAVHGITKKMLKDAPSWSEVVNIYREVTDGKTVLAFNEKFDKRLIQQTSKAAGVTNPRRNWACVMLAYSEWHGEVGRGEYRWQKLETAKKQLGIETRGVAHRAKSDATATLEVLKAMIGNTPEQLAAYQEELNNRPASAEQKEFARFFSVKLPPKCTHAIADEVLGQFQDELSERDPKQLEEWDSYQNILVEISDPDTREAYYFKEPGKTVLKEAMESLIAEGVSYSDIEEDLDLLVDRLFKINPSLERQ